MNASANGYIGYRHPIRVGPGAIDDLDHVNNAVYLAWVQEAIAAFWRATAPIDLVTKLAWIAHRHEVVYYRPAVLHDLIVADVRVTGHRGCRAHFETRFERADTCMACVRSTLVCMDRQTRQLVRIRSDLARHFEEVVMPPQLGPHADFSLQAQFTQPPTITE